ncbi:hypothetical protein M9H77_29898 [Catharanthus roseus]|uniref:Uncharacterized protein n=1 Tax=Catharanthus roseus TaxID=4058 RepID=A0ACB9ZZL2_CATRO|nr:hypothetical protein M9H77_29898 [Catharanthus roseus]
MTKTKKKKSQQSVRGQYGTKNGISANSFAHSTVESLQLFKAPPWNKLLDLESLQAKTNSSQAPTDKNLTNNSIQVKFSPRPQPDNQGYALTNINSVPKFSTTSKDKVSNSPVTMMPHMLDHFGVITHKWRLSRMSSKNCRTTNLNLQLPHDLQTIVKQNLRDLLDILKQCQYLVPVKPRAYAVTRPSCVATLKLCDRCQVAPRNIMASLLEKNPDCAVSKQTIYNVRAKMKKKRMEERNTVEEVFHLCNQR